MHRAFVGEQLQAEEPHKYQQKQAADEEQDRQMILDNIRVQYETTSTLLVTGGS